MTELKKAEFAAQMRRQMEAIGADFFTYNGEEARPYAGLYADIEAHIYQRCLPNAALALPLVRSFLLCPPEKSVSYVQGGKARFSSYRHALAIGRMLIDLNPPITAEEEDLALAAALSHVLNNMVVLENTGELLVSKIGLDARVFGIIATNAKSHHMSEKERKRFYDRISQNKLALLVKLADRGNLIEQLHEMSAWQAQDSISETRHYFLPMCIYAQEHYPELAPVITVLMEKMKCLIAVADILTSRYQERETALANEILQLQEDNARMRRAIALMEAEQE